MFVCVCVSVRACVCAYSLMSSLSLPVVVDVDEEFASSVIEKMTLRKADLKEYQPSGLGGKTRLVFRCPARGLIG